MTLKRQNLLLITLGLVLGVLLSIGHGVFAEREVQKSTLPLSELRLFTDVFARIKNDYVEPVEDRDLLEDAVRGMLSGLDPHSSFLDEEQFNELRVGTSGQFGGLGIEVGMEDGFVKVIAPIDDTPAYHAGVKAGDLVVRLDETPVKGLSLSEAVKIMRGKPGTPIVLTIVREGVEVPIKISITRAIIKVKSVKSRILEDAYGYVRISQFQAKTAENLIEEIEKLIKEADGQLKGMVLDLRSNPGGVLNAAVAVSDAFITDGLIVFTEGRVEDSKLRFSAAPGDILDGAPLVVLVNKGSASASEIVAGALQDQKRAIIVGTKTFGKGSVQTILPMSNGTAVKLTTARYFTPSGRSIQAEGILPDILLDNVQISAVETKFSAVTEADLSGHLINGKAGKDAGNKDEKEKKEESEPLAQSDYQLYEALNLLKGIYILQERLK